MRVEQVWQRPASEAPALSVLMPVFRTPAYVAEAVQSVLSQRDCVLDVLISDDCSADGTLEAAIAAAEAMPGPHAIRIFRSRRRLAMDHLRALVAQASCSFLVEAHGDDVSAPGRMARLLALHRGTGASLVTTLVRQFSDTGERLQQMPEGLAEGMLPDSTVIGWNPGVFEGARYGFDRAVYDAFPPLTSKYLARGHDALQAFRAQLVGGVYLSAEPLLHRRRHPGQWSRQLWDSRMPPAQQFGYALSKLGVLAAMRTDLDHFGASHPGDARVAALRPLVAAEESAMLVRLLAARNELRRAGFEPQWQPLQEIGRANATPLPWPPPAQKAARSRPARKPRSPFRRLVDRIRSAAGR